jgi:hypothetical protein
MNPPARADSGHMSRAPRLVLAWVSVGLPDHAAASSAGITLGVANDSTTNITARAFDQAGNMSACSNSISYTELP